MGAEEGGAGATEGEEEALQITITEAQSMAGERKNRIDSMLMVVTWQLEGY